MEPLDELDTITNGNGISKNNEHLIIQTAHKNHRVEIDFENLSYNVRPPGFNSQPKNILNSISGRFSPGQLTAIMGPSGAGKSSLLNVLAGYTSSGVTGSININGTPRQMKTFKKMSTYIMQDDLLQQRITVKEAMVYAAKLKLGSNLPKEKINYRVMEIINELGLINCIDTRTESLSGGQRKRLAVALELVNNPPIIFLDEPTSGLDNFSTKQCIDLLKNLSKQGKTVICTIHQPPDNVLKLFDTLFFMAEGQCIYNGSVPQIIPFLSKIGLPCPMYYNPAEYLIEVTSSSEHLKLFQEHSLTTITPINTKLRDLYTTNEDDLVKTAPIYEFELEDDLQLEPDHSGSEEFEFATGFWGQFTILLSRMFVQMRRDSMFIWIQAFHHVLSASLMGALFFGVGNDGSMMFANFKLCVCVVVFFAYTHTMASVLLFPSEVLLLKREYFNRWYSLKAYYCAMTISSIPLLTIAGMGFVVIIYLMASQPLDPYRFLFFSVISMLTALASQALGLLVGSIFNIKLGSIVGPAISAPLLIFAVYGMGYGSHLSAWTLAVMNVSYLRFGAIGLLSAVLSDRDSLPCPETEIYCHYADPKMLLRDMGMAESDYGHQVLGLVVIIVLYRVVTYSVLRVRVSNYTAGGFIGSLVKMFD